MVRSVACWVWFRLGGWWVYLLSLIPCLIKRVLHVCGGVVGVAGWNTSAAWFEHVPVFVAGGLAHCWVLRRHPVVGVFLVPLLAWLS